MSNEDDIELSANAKQDLKIIQRDAIMEVLKKHGRSMTSVEIARASAVPMTPMMVTMAAQRSPRYFETLNGWTLGSKGVIRSVEINIHKHLRIPCP